MANEKDVTVGFIPSLVSVSSVPTQINMGASDLGTSPFGRRASVSARLQDHPWDDSVGDFYLDDRSYDPFEQGTFWTKFLARAPYHSNYRMTVYDGYIGQALSAMTKREYLIENISVDTNSNAITVKAKDPLRLADESRSQFPRVTDLTLKRDDITDSQTSDIVVRGVETDLSDDFGNTGTTRYLRIGDEILSYTGYTSETPDDEDTVAWWILSGVTRAVLGTTADGHSVDDNLQRVGHYSEMEAWKILRDLLLNHTPIPDEFIDADEWDDEGETHLSPIELTGTVAEPTPVFELAGEITRDALFYCWWNERTQQIEIRAIRPAQPDETVYNIDDNSHIIANSAALDSDPDQRMSRVYYYYRQRDPTQDIDDIGNYERMRGHVDTDAQIKYGEERTRRIFSRWLQTNTQAFLASNLLITSYMDNPEFLKVHTDAKDREMWVGDIARVESRVHVDETGAKVKTLWRVIRAKEIVSGHRIEYLLQKFPWGDQRFWFWMDDLATDYSLTSEEDREFGGWYADTDDKVDGDEPYVWQ